jgi:hypothetical protein
MTYYTRRQVLEILELEESLLLRLEQEEIVVRDAPADQEGQYSERMLERARVASNLVRDLDVNLAGAAIIVHMREELARMRRLLRDVAAEMERGRP